jgi:hypothetical protein
MIFVDRMNDITLLIRVMISVVRGRKIWRNLMQNIIVIMRQLYKKKQSL